jgi:hypothetical protein
MNKETSKMNSVIPTFDIEKHHSKVKVPTDFDLRDLAKKFSIFPLKVVTQAGKKRLLLAMRNPRDQKLIYDVEFRAGMPVVPVQADDVDVQWLIQKFYFGRPLTPTPLDRPREVTHDMFEQLTMTTDAQEKPDWISEALDQFIQK